MPIILSPSLPPKHAKTLKEDKRIFLSHVNCKKNNRFSSLANHVPFVVKKTKILHTGDKGKLVICGPVGEKWEDRKKVGNLPLFWPI